MYVYTVHIESAISAIYGLRASTAFHSLLPPGQKQTVVEQMKVHGPRGQLELRSRNTHRLSVHLQELPVLHQPAGLRDQREDLQGKPIGG